MKTSYTVTFSVSLITSIKHLLSIMSPLLPQRLVGGTSYDGLKGEARSKRFVGGVCFYELCLAKGQDILPVSRKRFF